MKSIITDERSSEYCTAEEGEHVKLTVTQPKPSDHLPLIRLVHEISSSSCQKLKRTNDQK